MAIKPGREGRFLEDFEVGDIYRSSIGRTVTETLWPLAWALDRRYACRCYF